MRKLLVIIGVCAVATVGSSPVSFAGFDEGLISYKRGDFKTAILEFRKSATDGYRAAQFILGQMYFQGRGVAQDKKTAFNWYRKAAVQEMPPAQYMLGVMYRDGLGTIQNSKEAVKWFGKAASQGDVSSQYNLGVIDRKSVV